MNIALRTETLISENHVDITQFGEESSSAKNYADPDSSSERKREIIVTLTNTYMMEWGG